MSRLHTPHFDRHWKRKRRAKGRRAARMISHLPALPGVTTARDSRSGNEPKTLCGLASTRTISFEFVDCASCQKLARQKPQVFALLRRMHVERKTLDEVIEAASDELEVAP